MKFAHLSDIHLGGWREDSLRALGMQAFKEAIDICIKENVGFILIAGDLFNTSMPSIDVMKEAASILSKLREHDINVYVIPGSHDYSASGKTMIDVLETSGLITNVARLDDDKLRMFHDKTGIKIAGWHGRRGGLEKNEYWKVDMQDIEKETGFKVFMFHTMLEEFKPDDLDIVECMSVNQMPKGFSYYAGGHPHYVMQGDYGNGKLTYPGALFPNNFKELERFKHGGFYIITLSESVNGRAFFAKETSERALFKKDLGEKEPFGKSVNWRENDKMDIKWVAVKVRDVESLQINATNKNPRQVEDEIINLASNIEGKVVTLRIEGILKDGKPSDINFKRIDEAFSGSLHLIKNTAKLSSKEIENLDVMQGSVEQVEAGIVSDYLQKNNTGFDSNWINNVMMAMNKEKEDGETNNDFSIRVVRDAIKSIGIEAEYDNKEH